MATPYNREDVLKSIESAVESAFMNCTNGYLEFKESVLSALSKQGIYESEFGNEIDAEITAFLTS